MTLYDDPSLGEITRIVDHEQMTPAPNIPALAERYFFKLKRTMEAIHKSGAHHRNITMDKAKINHDWKIKKLEYKVR